MKITPVVKPPLKFYWGCPDGKTQRWFDYLAALDKEMRRLNPGTSCTFFPMEQKYAVFLDYHRLGNFHYEKEDALLEAIDILEKQKKK